MERLSLRELMLSTGGRLQNVDSPELSFDRVSIDSRDIRNGEVFWALKGEHHDGHDFIPDAFARQASLCVASATRCESIHGPTLIVEETQAALGRFAKWYRNRIDTLVIGVTGSVGKTTTREMIFAALSSQFQGTRSQLNFNNEIGLPLSLLTLAQRHEFAVLEMGAAAVGDIHSLCELADPEVGVVTAIGPAHLRTFGSMQAIIQTKGELLEHLPSTGFAVLPGDDAVLRQLADRAPCPVIFVGQGDDNQIRASRLDVGAKHLRFSCEGDDFEIPVAGRHALSNALCAIAIGLEVGIPIRHLSAGLANFIPVPGRCHVVRIGSWTVIDDTYNASPLAMAAACRLLRELPDPGLGRRLLVLGDMRELGDVAIQEHEQIGHLAAQLQIDRLLVCGDHADDVVRGAQLFGMKSHQIAAAPEADTLFTVLDCWLEPGDVLLIKGSRATRMERVIEWLKVLAAQEEHQRMNERPRLSA